MKVKLYMSEGIIVEEDWVTTKEELIKNLSYCKKKKKFFVIEYADIPQKIINPDKIIAIDFLEEKC